MCNRIFICLFLAGMVCSAGAMEQKELVQKKGEESFNGDPQNDGSHTYSVFYNEEEGCIFAHLYSEPHISVTKHLGCKVVRKFVSVANKFGGKYWERENLGAYQKSIVFLKKKIAA